MVAGVRRFNRVVTQRIGVLTDRHLATARPLGQNRILFEIGAEGADVRQLRARLDLDSGHLSRMLRALEVERLITVDANPADGRVRTAVLTDEGRRELDQLDKSSDDLAASILLPLNASQRSRLLTAMAEVEKLLTASTVEVRESDPRSPDARACLGSYYAELAERFVGGYDPARSPVHDVEMTPPAGLLLVASLHAAPVGCGALIYQPDSSGYVKRMWVKAEVRGLGLGRRILAELENRARSHGVTVVRLETRDELPEAIRMYTSSGYREVAPFNDEPYAHHWFEKHLDP